MGSSALAQSWGKKDNLSNYSRVVLTLVRFECWVKQEGLTKVTCSDPMHAARGRACVPRDPACKVIFILDKDCHPEDLEDCREHGECEDIH